MKTVIDNINNVPLTVTFRKKYTARVRTHNIRKTSRSISKIMPKYYFTQFDIRLTLVNYLS